MLAIIGGSGTGRLFTGPGRQRRIVRTPYGDPSGPIVRAEVAGKALLFLARHGVGHVLPPHRINYRANLYALKESGASAIVALAAVGGISADSGPGRLVIPHQIIDYTYGREATFFDGADRRVFHIDFTEPYDESLRARLATAAQQAQVDVLKHGVYAATQGPRLETAAEIERLRRDGATVVGMTGMPEAALARELELPYAHLCLVVNWAAGVADSTRRIDLAAIEQVMSDCVRRAEAIVTALAASNE
ncbi:MAG: S-methyl-5'-thioinosine phosphorylase [Casimicrobiaceae bacterium]|nr:S-methyl-5'-thioinosine phosphorylase [Casimicrobiaceae bacterium]